MHNVILSIVTAALVSVGFVSIDRRSERFPPAADRPRIEIADPFPLDEDQHTELQLSIEERKSGILITMNVVFDEDIEMYRYLYTFENTGTFPAGIRWSLMDHFSGAGAVMLVLAPKERREFWFLHLKPPVWVRSPAEILLLVKPDVDATWRKDISASHASIDGPFYFVAPKSLLGPAPAGTK